MNAADRRGILKWKKELQEKVKKCLKLKIPTLKMSSTQEMFIDYVLAIYLLNEIMDSFL